MTDTPLSGWPLPARRVAAVLFCPVGWGYLKGGRCSAPNAKYRRNSPPTGACGVRPCSLLPRLALSVRHDLVWQTCVSHLFMAPRKPANRWRKGLGKLGLGVLVTVWGLPIFGAQARRETMRPISAARRSGGFPGCGVSSSSKEVKGGWFGLRRRGGSSPFLKKEGNRQRMKEVGQRTKQTGERKLSRRSDIATTLVH